MQRIFAALFGSLLTLSASWAAAADPGLAAPSATAIGTSLPDLGGPAYAMLSRNDETQIGHMVMHQLRDQNMILEDPEVTDYIQQLGSRLAAQSHDDEQNFTYYVLREPVVNAFATYGGIICINSGLILLTDNESQLASVVAHETGHVVQRHMARGLQAQSRMSLASTAAMLAAMLIAGASGAGPEAMEGAMAMGQATALQQSINQIRGQEIEADAVGIELLAGAGYDPNQMASFFESMWRVEGLAMEGIPALLVDHPVTSDRVAAARSRAAQFPPVRTPQESHSFTFIKERIRVLTAPTDARLDQYYVSLSEHRLLTPAERYGQALVQMQHGEAALAVKTLGELQRTYPEMTILYAALGQALAADGQMDASLAFFQHSERLFPRNIPITVRYGETLMQAGQPKQAHELLLDLFNQVEPSPAQIRLTALAASAAGDAGDAYYYMSLYDLADGQLALANQQLELALASPDLTGVQRARFRAQLDQVRGWLREQQQSKHSGS